MLLDTLRINNVISNISASLLRVSFQLYVLPSIQTHVHPVIAMSASHYEVYFFHWMVWIGKIKEGRVVSLEAERDEILVHGNCHFINGQNARFEFRTNVSSFLRVDAVYTGK